jgi:glycosyltransferase involved in cell wall biosynthesis
MSFASTLMTDANYSQPPAISVIVPTHNRLGSLRRTISSLLRQDLEPNGYEIIVVDDGSTDGTEGYLRELSETSNLRFHTIRRAGPAVAHNRGAELARGQILVFIDDDCVAPTTWLQSIEQALQSQPVAAVGGSKRNQLHGNTYACVHDEMNRFISARLEREEGKAWYRATSNFACWASVFRKSGGLDERFFAGGEDREFVARLIKAGERVVHAREIAVNHFHEFTLASFLVHFFREGRGAYLLFRVIAREKGLTVTHLSLKEYVDLFRTVGRGQGFLKSIMRTALVLASQASAFLGYCSALVQGVKGLRRAKTRQAD